MTAPTDAVGAIADQWRRERPDLDVAPLLIFGRMERLTELFGPRLRPPFVEAGLADGDFNVLAALRRAGVPYAMTAGALSSALLVRTGTLTKRIDRLESRKLVRREVSRADARSRLITLRPAGVRLADSLIAVHLANEAALLAGLTPREREDLAALLARWAETAEAAGQALEAATPSGG